MTSTSSFSAHRRHRGFSLIELMITVAIITIVASIALPNYQKHVMRSHRGDAMSALLRIAKEQEKFYLQNNTYTDSLADLQTEQTVNDYYTLAIGNADADTFTATATPKTSGPQANDKDCMTFSINAEGTREAKSASSGVTTDICWR